MRFEKSRVVSEGGTSLGWIGTTEVSYDALVPQRSFCDNNDRFAVGCSGRSVIVRPPPPDVRLRSDTWRDDVARTDCAKKRRTGDRRRKNFRLMSIIAAVCFGLSSRNKKFTTTACSVGVQGIISSLVLARKQHLRNTVTLFSSHIDT